MSNPIPNVPATYQVNLWGSHPDNDNDDCWTGLDFATLEDARDCIAHPDLHFDMVYYSDTPFVELDGPDVYEVTQRKEYKLRAKSQDNYWSNERAMQAGMMGGCDAYNEEMGYV